MSDPRTSGSRDYPTHPRGCPCSGCYHSNVAEGAEVRTLREAEERVRALWASLDGWCPCRYADGLEQVIAAVRGTPHDPTRKDER